MIRLFFCIITIFSVNSFAFSFKFNLFPKQIAPSNGLVFYIKEDSLIGSQIKEEVSGQNLNITVFEPSAVGKKGNALRIASLSGKTIPYSAVMTSCAWLKIITPAAGQSGFLYGNNNYTQSYYGFGIKSGGADFGNQVWARITPFGIFSGMSQVATGSYTYIKGDITDDLNWHHYCTVGNFTAATFKLYRDGVLIRSGGISGTDFSVLAGGLNLLTQYSVAGGDIPTTNATPWTDEWRVYNRELTAQEISILYGLNY